MRSAPLTVKWPMRLPEGARPLFLKYTVSSALLIAIVAGCAPDSYLTARAFVVQGKLDHMTCAQLANQQTASSAQIDKLEKLMQKAGTETGGGAVGMAVYGPTLAEARANRRIIEETLVDKNCDRPSPQ